MPDPITPQDLYGPSNPPTPEGAPQVPETVGGLPVEETPEIPMPQTQPPPATKNQKTPFFSTLGLIILFIGLFGLGVWGSSFIRQFFPNGLVGVTPQQQEVVNAPTPTPTPVDPFATWKQYQVISGSTNLPIAGISYKLPPEVLAPVCDTTTCMSQGTYLPGGTRFTVAPRGAGQLLTDFRGSAISDVGGITFTTKDTTVNGHAAKEFTGVFSGKTVGGYGFTQMRGYMIEVTTTLSLEVNHFTPTGVAANFAPDDTLFNKIVSTLQLPAVAFNPSPTAVPLTSSSAGQAREH